MSHDIYDHECRSTDKSNRGAKLRAENKGVVAVARSTSRTLWDWAERHHVDGLAVIVVTLWLTIRVVEWAMDFADAHFEVESMKIAALIAAVLTPWGIMQAAMFKFYMDLKGRCNGNGIAPKPKQENG